MDAEIISWWLIIICSKPETFLVAQMLVATIVYLNSCLKSNLFAIDKAGWGKIWVKGGLGTGVDLSALPLRPVWCSRSAGGVPRLWLSGVGYLPFHSVWMSSFMMTFFVQNFQDLLSDLGGYLGLLLGWYISSPLILSYHHIIMGWYISYPLLTIFMSIEDNLINLYNFKGRVIPSWSTSPIFAAPGAGKLLSK